MSDPDHDEPRPKTTGEQPEDRDLPRESNPQPTTTEQIFED